jgi:hypothetical protein
VEVASDRKKDLQSAVAGSLPPELATKLERARAEAIAAEEAVCKECADELLDKLTSLEPSVALKHFKAQDVKKLKQVVSHLLGPPSTGVDKKELLVLARENLPQEIQLRLQGAEDFEARVQAQAATQRANKQQVQAQAREAEYSKLVESVDTMEPAGAQEHFHKLGVPNLKMVLAHLKQCPPEKATKATLLALVLGALPEVTQEKLRQPVAPQADPAPAADSSEAPAASPPQP